MDHGFIGNGIHGVIPFSQYSAQNDPAIGVVC
jgi:hypothetical protein